MKKSETIMLAISVGTLLSCSESNRKVENAEDVQEMASADTAVMYGDMPGVVEADGAEIIRVDDDFWSGIDYNAPVVPDKRITYKEVEVRRNPGYTIYSMDEKILFDVDKATLRPGAEEKLRSIAASIKDASSRGPIRIYGHTDSTASASYNKKLAEERANAVKNWLQQNEGIDSARMSVEAVGQERPIASNKTPEGRQQNRRVVIVVATRMENDQQPGRP